MERFKKVIQKRVVLLIILNVLAITFIALTSIYGNLIASGSDFIRGFIRGFQVGIFSGFQIIMLFIIVKYIKALRSEDALKLLHIEENDERAKLIKDKIGGLGLNISLGAIAITTIMAGFYDQLIFITLLCVLFFMVNVKGLLKIYYKTKY